MLTFKRKLILTPAQQQRIDSWIGACRVVYNLCMEIQRESYKNTGKYVGKYELMRQATELRRDVEWINDVPTSTVQNCIKRADFAYINFFKKSKLGGGFPKWAVKNKFKSITARETISIHPNGVKFPKIGVLKTCQDAPIIGNIKTATIIKDPTGYFICVVTDAVRDIQCKDESQVVGLDMGITHLYIDSNGNFIENPKHFKKYERQLRIENRKLSRKKKGGANWKKQCARLANLHHRISNVRKDYLHKESTIIAKSNYTVIVEDLNIRGMSKNKKLSKSILDCGWGIFRTMLAYKTNVVAISPKHTSQTCNSCGAVDKKSRLSQSEYVCTSCGHISNADLNAAKNILGKGIAIIRERDGIPCALGKNPNLGMSEFLNLKK